MGRSDEAAAALERAVAEGGAALASADPRHALRLGTELRGRLKEAQHELKQRVGVGKASLVASILPAAAIGGLVSLRLTPAAEAHSQALASRVAELLCVAKKGSDELLTRVREAGVEVERVWCQNSA